MRYFIFKLQESRPDGHRDDYTATQPSGSVALQPAAKGSPSESESETSNYTGDDDLTRRCPESDSKEDSETQQANVTTLRPRLSLSGSSSKPTLDCLLHFKSVQRVGPQVLGTVDDWYRE